jgi:hypothetical protein
MCRRLREGDTDGAVGQKVTNGRRGEHPDQVAAGRAVAERDVHGCPVGGGVSYGGGAGGSPLARRLGEGQGWTGRDRVAEPGSALPPEPEPDLVHADPAWEIRMKAAARAVGHIEKAEPLA